MQISRFFPCMLRVSTVWSPRFNHSSELDVKSRLQNFALFDFQQHDNVPQYDINTKELYEIACAVWTKALRCFLRNPINLAHCAVVNRSVYVQFSTISLKLFVKNKCWLVSIHCNPQFPVKITEPRLRWYKDVT